MRWFHLAVIVLFATITVVFAIQNFEIVTVSFLRFSAQTPLAFLIAVIYLLGALTGGSLLALLRQSIVGAQLGGSTPPRLVLNQAWFATRPIEERH
jgi:lipopolysaccharide assembly protein A